MANGRGTFMLYHNKKALKRIHFSGANVTGVQC